MIRDSKRRCIASILRLADCRFSDRPGGRPIEAPLSQEELAAISNLSRTSVSTIVRDLEDAGLITLGYRTIVLVDTDRLRAIVDDV
jgi:CRP-like cAMP-binding protein